MQLMGVVSEGEDFDHWVQDHHNPEHKGESTHGLKFKLIVQRCNTNLTLPVINQRPSADNKPEGMAPLLVQNCCAIKLRNILKGRCKPETKHIPIFWFSLKRSLSFDSRITQPFMLQPSYMMKQIQPTKWQTKQPLKRCYSFTKLALNPFQLWEAGAFHLSRRSFTALTSVENSISMTVFFFRSSQIITRMQIKKKKHKQWIKLAQSGPEYAAWH